MHIDCNGRQTKVTRENMDGLWTIRDQCRTRQLKKEVEERDKEFSAEGDRAVVEAGGQSG